MRKNLSLVCLCMLGLISCNEAETVTTNVDTASATAGESATKTSTEGTVEASETTDSAEITPIDTDSAAQDTDTMAAYVLTAFSQYVYAKNDAKAFLIDFNFFPEGTDFDSQNKTATLPCETSVPEEGGATVSLSAPEEGEDCDAIVVDLSTATFTFVGLEFAYETSLDVFAEAFEFKITSEGIADASDGEILDIDAEDANLENAYNAVMDRRL